jgi:hypothetical protein
MDRRLSGPRWHDHLTYGTQPFTLTSFTSLAPRVEAQRQRRHTQHHRHADLAGTFSGGSLAPEDSGGETFNVPVNITINPPVTLTTTALPIVTPGAGYSANLNTTGGHRLRHLRR